MLLNVAPPPNSTLPDEAMSTYQALGDFVRRCYGEGSIASTSALASTNNGCVNCSSVTLQFAGRMARKFDRVLMKEELREGQQVLSFELLANGKPIFNGSSIGRTLIALLDRNYTATSVELRVTSSRGPPSFRLVAVPNPVDCAIKSIHIHLCVPVCHQCV